MTTLRLSEPLQAAAARYADDLGISLNALVAVALADYLGNRGQLELVAQLTAKPLGNVPKVAAGQPCPCGSRKPYGKCHGRLGGAS